MKNLQQAILRSLGEDCEGGRKTVLVKAIGVLIVFSICLAIISTETIIQSKYIETLETLDSVIAALFLIEYILRIWVAPLKSGARRGIKGMADYAISPIAVIDLLAIVPTILGFITPELYLLRIIRLVRIGRLGRSERFQKSIKHFNNAIKSKGEELRISAVYSMVLVLISSSLMYLAEGSIQKEQFGSIPRCLWWSIITLTTVGYGDLTPVTALGKIIASLTAVCGIAVIAIPIGLISAGFSESINNTEDT